MKIAVAGLANSHPFSDAKHLLEMRPEVEFVVWDPSATRVGKFLDAHPDAHVAGSHEALVAHEPAVALVTVPPSQVPDVIAPFLDAGVPVVVTKPAVADAATLARLDEVVAGRTELFLSASILRFASAVEDLTEHADSVHVVAEHGIDYWRNPESRWQDEAGGLVPMMGVHAFELMELVLGPTMRITSCIARKTRDDDLTSPDVASGTAANDHGALATFEINGLAEGQRYAIDVVADDGTVSRTLGEGEDPYGSLTLARHVLAMADGGHSPVRWPRTRAVLQAIVDARRHSA